MENKYEFDPTKPYTIGEMYGPAMEITEQADADAYREALVKWMMEAHNQPELEARTITAANLGYYAGYYGAETQARVNRLFYTTHPIFGDVMPTAQEAYEAGISRAKDT